MAIRTPPFRFSRALQLTLLALVIVAPVSLQVTAQENGGHKRALMLFGDDSFIATQVMMEQALRATLKNGSPVPVEAYSEYLVNKLSSSADHEAELLSLLQRKYAGKKFDVIFAIGSYPISMSLRKRAELFSDTPIVFLTVDQRNIANLLPASGATGVWGEINFKANMELALALHPATKRVVVIQGASEVDRFWADKAKEDFRAYESRLQFSDLTGLTIPEMRNALAGLPSDTIVFFVSSIRDRAGNAYESPDFLRQISSASTAPIYGTTDAHLGAGVVGGSLLSFEAIGAEAGRVGLRILAGENPDSISPHAVTGLPMFDWRQLKQWGIREEALPQGSVVRFREPSVWEEYRWYIAGLLVLLIMESLLIGFLIYLRYKRTQAEAETARLHGRLKDIVANVPGIVWETRTDPETSRQITTFVSDYVRKMTGFSTEEWLKQEPDFGLRRTVKEDREKVVADTQAVLEKGIQAISEFRSKTRDGRLQWIENHISPIFNGDEKVVGLRGVALDVTDRKLAEENARRTEEKERALLAAIPDLMFLQSEDGVYLDYHAKDPSELLHPPESFVGKKMDEVLPKDLARRFAECFARTKEGGKPEILEYTMELDGAVKWFEARMVRSGTNILSVVRDISDLKRAQLEAQEVSGRLISAQEDERARLARELHDDACQNLALLSIELELLGRNPPTDDESLRANLKVLSGRVADLSNDLRHLSHQLHPARLARLGLGSAVRGLCNEIGSTHKLKVEFVEVNVPCILPTATSLNVYRIIQEAIQNVVKHSGASRASVTLSADDSMLSVSISDNGCGFDPRAASPKGSLGLISMRERVRLLRGEIKIDSRPGSSTRVKISIPLAEGFGSRMDSSDGHGDQDHRAAP